MGRVSLKVQKTMKRRCPEGEMDSFRIQQHVDMRKATTVDKKSQESLWSKNEDIATGRI